MFLECCNDVFTYFPNLDSTLFNNLRGKKAKYFMCGILSCFPQCSSYQATLKTWLAGNVEDNLW